MSRPVEQRRFTLTRVFVVSLILVAAFGTWGLIDPEGMSSSNRSTNPIC